MNIRIPADRSRGSSFYRPPSILATSITTVINAVDKGTNQATNVAGLHLWESLLYHPHKVTQQLDDDVTLSYPISDSLEESNKQLIDLHVLSLHWYKFVPMLYEEYRVRLSASEVGLKPTFPTLLKRDYKYRYDLVNHDPISKEVNQMLANG